MLKTTARILLALIALLPLGACSDDDDPGLPGFGEIIVTPEKDVYEVGDQVTCTIRMTSPGGPALKKATYWWYTSWWFQSTDNPVDFQEFNADNECVSSTITLTEAGDVKLLFFGRLEYPKYDWRKVEIAKTIKVRGTES